MLRRVAPPFLVWPYASMTAPVTVSRRSIRLRPSASQYIPASSARPATVTAWIPPRSYVS
jgi:hypothetical protein